MIEGTHIQADPVLICCAAIGVQGTFGNSEFSEHLSLDFARYFDPVRMIGSLCLSELHLGALAEAQLILSLEHSDHHVVWWEAVLFSFAVIAWILLCFHVSSSLDAFNFGPKVSDFRGGALALASSVIVHILIGRLASSQLRRGPNNKAI